MSLELWKEHTITLNNYKKVTVLDNAIVWRTLIDSGVMSYKDLCEQCNKSKSEVSKTLKVSLMPYLVRSCLARKKDSLSTNSAYMIFQVYEKLDEVNFAEFLHKVIDENLNRSEIEDLKKTVLKKVSTN